ncbi:MAG: hypothetical protein EAZ89_07805, partial [Bacteroidetes bacterium]
MDSFSIRGPVIIGFLGFIFLTYVVRLFSIQVLSDEYARKADNYVIRTKPIIPPRGNIYNRKAEIYVSNEPMFTMMILKDELVIPDTSVLIENLGMTQAQIDKVIAEARD